MSAKLDTINTITRIKAGGRRAYLLEAAALHERREALAVPGVGVGAVRQEKVEKGRVEGVDEVDL